MLHLAQVQNKENGGGVELRLLARQHSENSWAVINPENVAYTNGNSLHEDALVLVDLSDKREVLSIQNAKDWVLDLVQQYLTIGVSPNFLKEEAERAEQWRQKLTLDSQDLTRRHLEMEARREQIQTLEEELTRQMEEKQKPKSNGDSD
jgi:polyhydroxyalkanoate synthesis regulator phasin